MELTAVRKLLNNIRCELLE